MGSPIVFHTAPPQPSSNARITCSPQLAGGPDASQKGLGQRMPAKLVVRSATDGLRNRIPRTLAIGHRIYHFTSAVHTVAAGIILGIARPSGLPVDDDTAVRS